MYRFNDFQCFTEAGGDFAEFSKCVDGDEGKKLQLAAEKETKVIAQPKLQSVPTVVFNNVSENLSHFSIPLHNKNN